MAEPSQRRYPASSGRRSPTLLNPARSSLPVGVDNHGSYRGHGGDIHVLPVSRHDSLPRTAGDFHHHHNITPVTTTTYSVRKDRDHHGSGAREGTGRVHRSSTIDASSKRPPIIVTTKHVPPGSHAQTAARADSPSGDPYRSSDEGLYYTQPASSMHRSRSTARAPYSAVPDEDDDYERLRERTGDDRLYGSRTREYRPPRYHHIPRHDAVIDYGDEGYEYTKPSDLARYDLDTNRHHRPRRESLDRSHYHRPSVSVSTDIGRPYDQNDKRSHGPPPTTRGLDKVNRNAVPGAYDPPHLRMPVLPHVPHAPDSARRPGHEIPSRSPPDERRGTSQPRPAPLYQDSQGRSHHDDLYRSREDPFLQRELRERDREYFQDNGITTRGFGIRTGAERRDDDDDDDDRRGESETRYHDEKREWREPRRHHDDREPRRLSDEDMKLFKAMDERHERLDRDYRGNSDDQPLRARRDDKDREGAYRDDDRDARRDKVKDKLATGLEIAAATLGLGAAVKGGGRGGQEDRSPVSRRRDDAEERQTADVAGLRDEDRHRPTSKGVDDSRAPTQHGLLAAEPPRGKEYLRKEGPKETAAEPRDYERHQAGAKADNAAADHRSRDESTSEEDGKGRRRTRGRRTSSVFDPNDAAGLVALKAQLAASEGRDRPSEKPAVREIPGGVPSAVMDKLEPSSSEAQLVATEDESRGQELVQSSSHEEKQVRVVSPPREKDDRKPIKGILKQPSSKFPEDPNPVREGVAPHKDDKSKTNVPSGARWTKINRQLVNPEALTIGKERFEVRDNFVIVLRVLSKDEIQAYAAATAQLRERRRRGYEGTLREHEHDYERDEDDERRRRHRPPRRDRNVEYEDDKAGRDRDREREREHTRGRELERDRERDRDRHRPL